MVQRTRKVHPVCLFWTLVLRFGIGHEHSIASVRRAYEEATGTFLSGSSFSDRFTGPLVVLWQQASARALRSLHVGSKTLEGALSAFGDVLMTAAPVLR